MEEIKDNTLSKFLKPYEDDEKVLKSIIKERNLYQNSNLSTQAKYGETLIIKHYQLTKLADDLLQTVGTMDIEIEQKDKKIGNLQNENDFLKEKLDENSIVYENELCDLINNNNDALVLYSDKNIRQRGLNRLLQTAKKNRKL